MRKLNIGIIKGIFVFVAMILCIFITRAQDNTAIKDKIREIKLNEDFIFGEGVSNDKEIAYGIAMDDLLIFANEIKDRNSQETLSMSDLVTKVETLVYENGSRYEVIVYIPFKIVIDTNRKDPSARSGVIITKPGFSELEEEPEIEEVVAMVPDNILTNETPEEVIILEDNAPVEKELPIQKEPQLPIKEAPEEDIEASEPIIEEPQPVISQEVIKVEIAPSNVNSVEKGDVEDFLLTQDNFSEIKSFLSEMKQSGKIKETGATDSNFNLPTDASLILMDEYGGILAVLSPAQAEGRTNYKTHKSDSEKNYNSKFIVWYRK